VHALLERRSMSAENAARSCADHLATGTERWRLVLHAAPREMRPDLVALLAWMQLARAAGFGAGGAAERRARIADLRALVDEVFADRARGALGLALAACVPRRQLSALAFQSTLLAMEEAASLSSWETRAELATLAGRIAHPLGRSLLRVYGAENERHQVLADLLATFLQLLDWLVHARAHLERGRLFVPMEDVRRTGADLSALVSGRADPSLRRLATEEIAWQRSFLARGWALGPSLGARNGRLLVFVLRWHAATLAALETRADDVLARPPPAGWIRFAACAWASLLSTGAPRLE
jgi:phytoene/squalene synthetase